jgi:hypothetical protein
MKKLATVLMVALVLLIFVSAKKNRAEKWLSGNWGQWRTNSSYPGIDFRIKKESSTDIWWVELKNRYQKKIGINVYGCDGGDHCGAVNRLKLAPGAISDDWYVLPHAADISVVIEKLKWDEE